MKIRVSIPIPRPGARPVIYEAHEVVFDVARGDFTLRGSLMPAVGTPFLGEFPIVDGAGPTLEAAVRGFADNCCEAVRRALAEAGDR